MNTDTENQNQEKQASDTPNVTAKDTPQATLADTSEDLNKDENSSCCGSCS